MKRYLPLAFAFFAIYASEVLSCCTKSKTVQRAPFKKLRESAFYEKVEKERGADFALLIAAKAGDAEQVKKYVTSNKVFKTETIEKALHDAIKNDKAEIVKLLLSVYDGDFIIRDGFVNCSMLGLTLSMFYDASGESNFEPKIINILQLIEAGASPFTKYGPYDGNFLDKLPMVRQLYTELNDPRIDAAIEKFPAQELARMQKKSHAVEVTQAILCESDILNGIGDLADIVKEYIFGAYILDKDEPKTVRFHDEK